MRLAKSSGQSRDGAQGHYQPAGRAGRRVRRARVTASTLLLAVSPVPATAVPAATIPQPDLLPDTSAVSATGTTLTANTPPSAGDDQATVVAGGEVHIAVLANDVDDGLGGVAQQTPALQVVGVEAVEPGWSFLPDAVVFASRAGDRGVHEASYTVSDGQLQAQGRVSVTVVAPAGTPTVTLHLPSRVLAGREASLSGRVSPAEGASVLLQRRVRAHWSDYRQVPAPDDTGRFAGTIRVDRLGALTLRAVATWPDRPAARSEPVTRDVRALADARLSPPLARRDVPYSWRPGCPVGPAGLRRISVNYLDYSGRVARGSLVVRAGAARDLVAVFRAALAARFPIKRMQPADVFYAGGRRTPTQSDVAAMEAGNTSAFNCRTVTGNPYRISQHSYGNAVDINTIENPYGVGSRIYPSWARTYLDRSHYRRGMILPQGVVAKAMRGRGWAWGARWASPDYQHFSSNGG
jgi:hypothetical protein